MIYVLLKFQVILIFNVKNIFKKIQSILELLRTSRPIMRLINMVKVIGQLVSFKEIQFVKFIL